MKVSPIKIESQPLRLGLGTGKVKGLEVYPTTKALLERMCIDKNTIEQITLKQTKRLKDLPPLASINKLRDYQKEDVKFLAARNTAACFNEQRTGKTPISLSTMKVKAVRKLLIIAPASTLYTWAKECKNWYFEDLPAIVVDGSAAVRRMLIERWTEGALIISYECLREVTRYKKMRKVIY